MELIDSHLHLPHKNYNKEIGQMIREAKAENVSKLICIGTDINSSRESIEIAKMFEDVYTTVGVYPHDEQDKSIEQIKKELEELISSSVKIVGIGECGIDIPTNLEGAREINSQKELFEMQVELASKHKLPVVVHNRNGDEQILEILRKNSFAGKTLEKGVIHCFTGSWAQAQEYINLGFLISFSGIITYPSGTNIHETVINAPSSKFIVETDAPYLAPQQVRKSVNEPKYVKMTAQKVSELRGTTLEQIASYTYTNTKRLFNI